MAELAADCRPGTCDVATQPASELVLGRGVRLATGGLVAATAVALVIALAMQQGLPRDGRGLLLGLAVAGILSWFFPLRFGPRLRLELDTAVAVAAVLLLPIGFAGVVAGLGPLAINLRRREPWTQALFNASQSCLQGLLGGAVLLGLGWKIGAPSFVFPQPLPQAALAALAMYALNTAAVAGIVALQDRVSFWATWRAVGWHLDRTEAAAHGAQVGLGILAAAVATVEPWLLCFLVLPAAAVFAALDHHTRLRIQAEDRLLHQATHDPLTDLPNRALLVERLEAALARTADGASPPAVLMVDLDHFKAINDGHGHQAGDRVLTEVAARLRGCVPDDGTVARLGGDEFTVLLEHLRDDEVDAIAERIAAAMAVPVVLGQTMVRVTTSIGIAAPGSRTSAGTMLHEADVALYRVKDAGRAGFARFTAMGS